MPEPQSVSADSQPAVAVIMRSKNEEPYASQTLERLFEQDYSAFTLYNVDSGSTDGTLEAIRRHNPRPENIREILPKDYIPGRVLNEMIEAVKRSPFEGIGKPEPLRENLAGFWSRRIDDANRLVYAVNDDLVTIISCRYHY